MSTPKALLCLFLLAGLSSAQQSSGIDRSWLDPTCKPCEDFWRYADGGWIAKNPIPARFPSWSTMAVLSQSNHEKLAAILDAAANNASAAPGSDERRIGDFYTSCLDTAAIDARGLAPLQPDLDRLAGVASPAELVALLTSLQREAPVGPFLLTGTQDYNNSTETIANLGPAAISLPDRDYYFKDDPRTQRIREEFVKHVAKMFELLGDKPEPAAANAKTVMSFETALADAMLTNVQRRDPYARYHRMDLAGVAALVPTYDWKSLLRHLQLPESTPVNVTEPRFFKELNRQLAGVLLSDWKTWARWRIVNRAAEHLSKAFRDQDFYFSSTVLRGVKEQQPRWELCTNTLDRSLGDAVGRLYVQRYFPPEAKRRALELVENLRAALSEQLDSSDWLAAETRKNAAAKLAAFTAKIGYPDRWRDYSGVKIGRGSYFENVRAAALANRLYNLAKIGKPLDRNDWGMTPPTVNAYYNSLRNEIAFPAGILQPPFFDMSADDAINYGAIGAVIGHEMGHGFDDQGSKFDAEGNLKNWWRAEDRAKFEARAACVVEQFDTLDVGEGLRHNGKLVVGEALGDLGGLTLAYKAYQRSLRGKPAPPAIDGFTADQRFFLAFTRTWAGQHRPEAQRLRLNTDPHPLYKFRANGTLQNMPEFHKAFHCQPGDPMVRPPDKQCKLW